MQELLAADGLLAFSSGIAMGTVVGLLLVLAIVFIAKSGWRLLRH
jgi:hypothetical protein